MCKCHKRNIQLRKMKKRIVKQLPKKDMDFSEIVDFIKRDLADHPSSNKYEIEGGDPICRVCGFRYDGYFPWRFNDGQWFPSYDICVCCNAEFGFEDESLFSIRAFREKWILDGANFYHKALMPSGWIYKDQLKNIRAEWQ